MSEVERVVIKDDDGQEYEIFVESKTEPTMPPPRGQGSGLQSYGGSTATVINMQQAQQAIRFYVKSVLNALKDIGTAEIEEVSLKFGLKMGGKAGIPYITEGSAESNIEIQVKCKFPETQKSTKP